MKVQGACRLLLLGAMCTAIFLTSVITASAQNCEFSLTNAQSEVGRLFRFSLECNSTKVISAFIAEIEYDAQALKYRSVSKESENGEYSINVLKEGKLKLVYMCEEGADDAPLLEFTFKAERSGEFKINACFEQVIDTNGADVTVNSVSAGIVTVNSPDKIKMTQKAENIEQYTNITEPSAENKTIVLEGSEQGKALTIMLLLFAFAHIGLGVVFLYIFGVKKRKK